MCPFIQLREVGYRACVGASHGEACPGEEASPDPVGVGMCWFLAYPVNLPLHRWQVSSSVQLKYNHVILQHILLNRELISKDTKHIKTHEFIRVPTKGLKKSRTFCEKK